MPSGPLVVPSLRSGHYSLGAFGPLNPIETLESASNYYLEYTCSKYCNLIGLSEVHYFHRDLQLLQDIQDCADKQKKLVFSVYFFYQKLSFFHN